MNRVRTDLSSDCPVYCNDFAGPIVWAERPGVGFLAPYSVPTETCAFFSTLKPGMVLSSEEIRKALRAKGNEEEDNEEQAVDILLNAWIVFRQEDWEIAEAQWEERRKKATAELNRDGYTVLSDLLPYLHGYAFETHCQALFGAYENSKDNAHMLDHGAYHFW